MITCSKCHKEFPIELNRISKDSHIECIYCSNECLVKLFDLQNHSSDSEGFQSLKDIDTPINEKNVENDSSDSNDHFINILILLKILLILFIIGLFKAEYLYEKFPGLGRVYDAINIKPQKKLIISKVVMHKNNAILEINLQIHNPKNRTDLISNIEIFIIDVFHNTITTSIIYPYTMIKSDAEKELKVNVPGITEESRYVSIAINGRIYLNKELINQK